MIKAYYLLTKPGIIYSNIFTAVGGFFLASKGHVSFTLLLAMIVGLACVIASACVFNNYMDRGIDAKMSRTKNRALVKKIISGRNALMYATILGLIGFSLLLFYTNLLTAFIAFIGFFFYVIMYGIWKRRSVYGTIVGSVSGAVPPVVGYCAVIGRIDMAAILLFLILVLWQMPHFYAIALFRSEDYKAAAIPVLPVKKGFHETKIQMLLYIIAFCLVVGLPTVFHYTGNTYVVVMVAAGIVWLGKGMRGLQKEESKKWARSMFFFSLIIIVLFSVTLSLNSFLP